MPAPTLPTTFTSIVFQCDSPYVLLSDNLWHSVCSNRLGTLGVTGENLAEFAPFKVLYDAAITVAKEKAQWVIRNADQVMA